MQSLPTKPEHLASARAGNSEAFTALVEPHRRSLLMHCYRMSGSLDDAEDLVQETFLRAWNKLKSFEGQGSFRNWLYVIATRLWLDEARKRKKQVLLPLDGDPADPDSPPQPVLSSGTWLDPLPESWLTGTDPSPEYFYERRETISFAFMIALHKLNPRQRVVLILREVFNWSAEEAADALGLTVDSVNNHLYRARKNLAPAPFEIPCSKTISGSIRGCLGSWRCPLSDPTAAPESDLCHAADGRLVCRARVHSSALHNFVFVPGVKWKLTSHLRKRTSCLWHLSPGGGEISGLWSASTDLCK